MTLGEYIKAYLDEHEISQRQIAEKIDVSPSYINILVRGTNNSTGKPMIPSFPVMARIAKGMGMSVDDLFRSVDDTGVYLPPETPTREDYAALGVAARIAVDTSDTLRHQSARPSALTLKSVIKQLEEIDKQNAFIMAEDERQLLDAYRHMKTDTQRKILAMMESWRDF